METTSRSTWNFYSAGRLLFGPGAVRELGAATSRLKVNRVLIITDKTLLHCGVVDTVRESLESAGIACFIFDGGEPEPTISAAERAIAFGTEERPEGIVGLGGGSNMDLAKIVANVLSHGGHPSDYFGFDQIPGPILPLVCIPTTAGTGSEVSHAAVLTDTGAQIKVSTLSQYIRPALAVVDPDLTLSCPPKVTADSGIDALTHAIEACTATDYRALPLPPGQLYPYDGAHPLGTCLAEKAIELIGTHLEVAVHEPSNRAAREGMALAATLAGLAFSNCAVAVVHALEYPLGGALHCSHGAGNGLLLPYVMRFNLPARVAQFARIGRLLGLDASTRNEHQMAEAAVQEVERLRSAIGIPERIRDLGGRAEQLPEFAAKAFAISRLMLLNARQPTEEDLLAILQEAL